MSTVDGSRDRSLHTIESSQCIHCTKVSAAAQGTTVWSVTSFDSVGAVPEPPRYPVGVKEAGIGMRFLAYLIDAILQAVTLGIGWLIWAAIVAGRGRTPAKQLLGLRVIDARDSQPLGFARMFFMRGIIAGLVAAVLIALTLGIILLMPVWNERKRNIWDKLSSSVVVVDQSNAWGL
jgi:uncharacterized RDD family membrane protein YckC